MRSVSGLPQSEADRHHAVVGSDWICELLVPTAAASPVADNDAGTTAESSADVCGQRG